jgi:hypothetical protein
MRRTDTVNDFWLAVGGTKEEKERICNSYVAKYIETRNPLWAYEALDFWVLFHGEYEPGSFPLPRELFSFLCSITSAIQNLSAGMKPPEYRDGKRVERSKAGKVTPNEACDFLPEALGLRGYKWNAFSDFRRDLKADRLQHIKRQAREAGKTEAEAMELVMRAAKTSDDRTAYRKLAGGRGPRQKSPYPLPEGLRISAEKAEPPPLPDPKKAKAGTKEKKDGAKKP